LLEDEGIVFSESLGQKNLALNPPALMRNLADLKLLKNYSFILRVILKGNDCGSFWAKIPIASQTIF
jgi:hypothetical protein